ncbi:MAG: tyrosine-protein kinase family protein [Candidatus Hodarchaeota archaeon]
MEKILVHSYKGGTGKTTVAINTANLLAHNNRVLLIESDFIMPSFSYTFNLEPDKYFNDYFKGTVSFNETIVHNVQSNLDVIFTDKYFDPDEKIISSDQEWFFSSLEMMVKDIEALEDQYDFVIFDTPPGWHLIVVNLIVLSDIAILILRPSSYAVNGTKRMIEILYKRAKPLSSWGIYLLFNQIPEIDMRRDLEQWAAEFQKEGIKYAGEISCSCNIAYEMAHEAMIFPSNHRFNLELQKALKFLFNR